MRKRFQFVYVYIRISIYLKFVFIWRYDVVMNRRTSMILTHIPYEDGMSK